MDAGAVIISIVFMTTTLLNGCNLSLFLLQCQVYSNLRDGLASLFMSFPISSCVSFTQIRLHILSNYCLPVHNIIELSLKCGPPSGGEKYLLCNPRPASRLEWGKKKGEDDSGEGENNKNAHLIHFEVPSNKLPTQNMADPHVGRRGQL